MVQRIVRPIWQRSKRPTERFQLHFRQTINNVDSQCQKDEETLPRLSRGVNLAVRRETLIELENNPRNIKDFKKTADLVKIAFFRLLLLLMNTT